MAKSDAYKNTYPIKLSFKEKELASRDKIQAIQKMTERAFGEIERAIGDIYNTQNATNSVLSDDRLYINSLGRSIGPMSDLVPILSGISQYTPVLSSKMEGLTYNVIPHPTQTVKCEVGCKWDATPTPNATSRACLKGQTAFYRKIEGANTGVCQNTSCPDWSARDGQKINSSICQPDPSSQTFRDYKLVLPKEARTVATPRVKYYSNCGISYDKYRTDLGAANYFGSRAEPTNTYAFTQNISEPIAYTYPNLSSSNTYNLVIEVPALETDQVIQVNNVALASVQGVSTEPTRYYISLSSLTNISNISIKVTPKSTGASAALSQIWLIENNVKPHFNFDIPLLLPSVLDDLSAGTEIPPNFLQVFDTKENVNQILANVKTFSARFNPLNNSLNQSTNRDSFDVRIYGDQKLEVGNSRYLAVTVGTPLAPTLGALLEAFVEHASDTTIHHTREEICQLLADRTYCCDDKLQVELASLSPANKIAPTSPASYIINAHIYGGFPPYTVTVDWGDGNTDLTASPIIVSGVQTFELTNDVRPPDAPYEFRHTYTIGGTYDVTFDVVDDPNVFACEASLTPFVTPFNVGSPPSIDSEVRLDYATSYPNFVFQDITAGYNFTTTSESDWLSNPTWHVLTQVNNSDEESGKPDEFYWSFNNPEGLTFKFQYEDVSGVYSENVNFTASTANLANNLIQQNSVVVSKGTTVFIEGVDYTVNYETGVITATGSSIGSNETNFEVDYFHYHNAVNSADVSNQWITLGSETNAETIDLSSFTTRTDLNTIRLAIKE